MSRLLGLAFLVFLAQAAAACSSLARPAASAPAPIWATQTAPTPAALPAPARERIKAIQNYVVYYGAGRMDDLTQFDLAIIQPETLADSEIAGLKSHATLVVGYLSLGEAEAHRPWFADGRVDPSWLLGKNENWGSYYVDSGQAGWQQLMIGVAGEMLGRGFDGIFLDTVDTVDVYPHTAPGMVDLIRLLRQSYPDAVLVQNRGFSIVDETALAVDAVVFEGLSTTYDFEKQEYGQVDNSQTAQAITRRMMQAGLTLLSLDYAAPGDFDTARRAVEIARDLGFVPAVSVITLDDILDYGGATRRQGMTRHQGAARRHAAPRRSEGGAAAREWLLLSLAIRVAGC